MAEYYSAGNTIEGNKVSGTSRKPLIHRGETKYRGVRCWKFSAQFNVTAKVDAVSGNDVEFDKDAARELGASLKCDKAVIHSGDKKPGNQLVHGSSTHKTNAWRFSETTNVAIEQPHQELVDGARKRALQELQEPTSG